MATRLQDNFPYHHPLYMGQMLKPPHAIARLAYSLAMFLNPNNHALDGGRATSAMEKEAVAQIAEMFGWTTHLGHLCAGGTMAISKPCGFVGSCSRAKPSRPSASRIPFRKCDWIVIGFGLKRKHQQHEDE